MIYNSHDILVYDREPCQVLIIKCVHLYLQVYSDCAEQYKINKYYCLFDYHLNLFIAELSAS